MVITRFQDWSRDPFHGLIQVRFVILNHSKVTGMETWHFSDWLVGGCFRFCSLCSGQLYKKPNFTTQPTAQRNCTYCTEVKKRGPGFPEKGEDSASPAHSCPMNWRTEYKISSTRKLWLQFPVRVLAQHQDRQKSNRSVQVHYKWEWFFSFKEKGFCSSATDF